MRYGIVKEYYEERGFGFLEDEMGHEIFVHISQLQLEAGQRLEEGDRVSYEIAVGAKGPQAIHVKIENESKV
ncbi:MAG: cold shock domain-containing protein [Firmicutes bacterium]|uniref:Cold shock domain-containing protein n=1 Tax=Candidatus Scybalomonas excrementavium TaxID=2840943 RepID=A0A9D9N7S0_9FIRM|nr:cold shock domain-containing protein [Candidatus Scybalomonas excrementavium]